MTSLARLLLRFLGFFVLFVSFVVGSASAHPVGERSYDRTIVVRLTADAALVAYELEVNTATVGQDLADLGDEIDLSKCRQPRDFYDAFVRYHAPVLAARLDAALDGHLLNLTCTETEFEVREKVSLHARFLFRASWQPAPDRSHRLTFRDGTYEQRGGKIRLSLTQTERIVVSEVTAPSAGLQAKPLTMLAPGEADRLREASATFSVTRDQEPRGQPRAGTEEPAIPRGNPEPALPSAWQATSLEDLLLYRGEALWVLMLVGLFLGGAHALTPGHGKTLVAAYLVGERGTVAHALYLGLVTTLAHTGVVLLIAGLARALWGDRVPSSLQAWLGFGGGLIVAGMGVWLLLARLTGRADHVHLVGGHHHHHGHGHGHGGHYDDEHGHAHPMPAEGGWWRLTILGITGGMIPCHDAVAIFFALAGAGLLAFALPVLLAFSAGLAAVLVAIGIVVVKAKGALGRRWGEGRLIKALPIVSAVLVTCVGLWLCYHSLQPGPGR